jgi:two-component system, chemotaxis family, protein-glutamate methylesterase/glutaminase
LISVLIVDDSMTAQRTLVAALEGQPDIHVVGQAATGVEAVALAQRLRPTLITMDIRMPDMDGLTATEQIMAICPTRIIIVSSEVGATDQSLTFRALNAGALEVLPKPRLAGQRGLAIGEFESEFVSAVRAMAEVPVVRRRRGLLAHASPPRPHRAHPRRAFGALAIGASTGGPQVLVQLCAQLPPDLRLPILIVQHMSPGFTTGFARWLGQESPLRVKLAEHGERIEEGGVYVAPDGLHLRLGHDGRLQLGDEPPVGHFRPSVDELFRSCAESLGPAGIGLLMTGMGTDGASGLLAMRRAGAWTLAQDAESCVVNGMPAAAKKLDAVDEFVAPADLPGLLIEAALGN